MKAIEFGTNYRSHINRFTGEPEPMAFGTPDSVVLTKVELVELLEDAFDAGYNRCNHCYMVGQVGVEMNNESFPDKQTFISSIINT